MHLFVQLYKPGDTATDDVRTTLKALTGCPVLRLEETKWSKIRNIKKHPNIFGFAIDSDGNVNRISGA
jgi:hypothetical protein